MTRLIVPFVVLAALAGLAPAAFAGPAEDELLTLLREGGQVVLMRHTVTTPGVGDPPGMQVQDCATQRNLSEAGRRDAKAIGEKLKTSRISFDHVASSPLCRCKDTAQLTFGRIDMMLAPTGRGEREVREMRAFLSEKRRGNAVLVSHGTTIHNAVGIDTAPGEMVIITPAGDGGYIVRGKLGFTP